MNNNIKLLNRIKSLKIAAAMLLAFAVLLTSAPAANVYAYAYAEATPLPGNDPQTVTEVRGEAIFGYSTMVPLTKAGSAVPFDLRTAAGQKLFGYDTLQGACANGGFGYFTLFNRNKDKCRIVKVELSSLNVVKVSGPLPIYHANNLTYNTRKNLLLATCCQVKDKRAVFIDPVTLTVVSKKDIKLKASKKIPKSVVRKYKGFTAIAYNEKHDCYVGRLRGDNNVIIFNSKLKPVRYVKLKGKRTSLLNQGMESVDDYIYDVRSFKGKYKYSLVTIHTMSGKYVGKMKFPYGNKPGNELECIFHDGGRFYAGFYYTTSQKHDDKKHHVKRFNYIYELKTD